MIKVWRQSAQHTLLLVKAELVGLRCSTKYCQLFLFVRRPAHKISLVKGHYGNKSNNIKILSGSRRTVSCQNFPSSPQSQNLASSPVLSGISETARRKIFVDDGILPPRDSGFNSDPGSSGFSVGINSDCLEHYGLDGPLVPLEELSSHQV